MGIAVVEKKVSQALLECRVEEGEVVENKTWREASREENWFVILQDFGSLWLLLKFFRE